MTAQERWTPGPDVHPVTPVLGYQWTCPEPVTHEHTNGCLWVWHDCSRAVAVPDDEGQTRGWCPMGTRGHELVSAAPLTLMPSLWFSDCCGLHGWLRDGQWVSA